MDMEVGYGDPGETARRAIERVSAGPNAQRVALTALQHATAELVAGGALPRSTRALN